MTEPVGPISSVSRSRRVGRAAGVAGRRAGDQRPANLPVVTERPADEPAPAPPAGASEYAAQTAAEPAPPAPSGGEAAKPTDNSLDELKQRIEEMQQQIAKLASKE